MLALPHIPAAGAGRPLLVGLSGGLDSTVLLQLLAASSDARARGLRALHVHHGLHPGADTWAALCQQLCDDLGIELTIIRAQVRRDGGEGLEAAARHARYAAFDAAMRDDDVLVLAHHRDDQAETFLLRALRASGPDGLAAMRAWRTFGRGWLWRPLLEVPRPELLRHAQQHGLQWIDDASNADTAFDRNFLRHRVLPLLRERWASADAALARSAELCAQAADLLDEEDVAALAGVRDGDGHRLDVPRLLLLGKARRARVLRRWIAGLALAPLPAQAIARIESELLRAAPDAQPQVEWSGAWIRRWRSALHAGRRQVPWPDAWMVEWDGSQPLRLPDDGSLHLDGAPAFDAPMRVRARQGGERITLPGRAHSHSLKHVLQACDVPPWQRAQLPLLFAADGGLLAAGDSIMSAAMAAWLHERGAHLRHVAGND
ncbi:tRNA lysidine(34) synthetase TilS [Cognatiluteimonas profundi]|uniref:tRNA lysidine(34) synthetase TilS n=1 Tax=Cognatiluteimonas profundi TaxID=2594501 RepID=UPI00131B237D|nr:tRNA lysidine(34) synthetase TilS [Lysobacter profundi]